MPRATTLCHSAQVSGTDNRTAIAAATKIGGVAGGYSSAILGRISRDLEAPTTNPTPTPDPNPTSIFWLPPAPLKCYFFTPGHCTLAATRSRLGKFVTRNTLLSYSQIGLGPKPVQVPKSKTGLCPDFGRAAA